MSTPAIPLSPARERRDGRLGADASGDTEEVGRLRRRVRQQEDTIARLTDALLMLRRGSQALREENRALHHELHAPRRV